MAVDQPPIVGRLQLHQLHRLLSLARLVYLSTGSEPRKVHIFARIIELLQRLPFLQFTLLKLGSPSVGHAILLLLLCLLLPRLPRICLLVLKNVSVRMTRPLHLLLGWLHVLLVQTPQSLHLLLL